MAVVGGRSTGSLGIVKMSIFEIRPHESLGPISLGAVRSEARTAMATAGFPLERSRGAVDYFCRSSVQTESGTDDRIMFVGVSPSDHLTIRYLGVDVFDVAAEELFALIEGADQSGSHNFEATEYCFPNQIVTLYSADEQYDRVRGSGRRVWGQIGIGNHTYAAAIAASKHDA